MQQHPPIQISALPAFPDRIEQLQVQRLGAMKQLPGQDEERMKNEGRSERPRWVDRRGAGLYLRPAGGRLMVRVLIAGCGTMGSSHARAYRRIGGFEIVGVVSRGPRSRERLAAELGGVPTFADYGEALAAARPDAVAIATYPGTHAPFAAAALEAGAHVFVEKPLGTTVAEAEAVVAAARRARRKVVVGYILRHHPGWRRFIELARGLGKPLVMRMNLNQQSSGAAWQTHRSLMESLSPIVDCGVHYVDVMCQMTRARPVRVHAVGARLTGEIDAAMYNYGQLQVAFEDGSVGWYEAGWGPMMSETAFFVKDVIGPAGSVSMVGHEGASADVNSHTQTTRLLVHGSALRVDGAFASADRFEDVSDEPDHQGLCDREQAFFLDAINRDVDLDEHLRAAVDSLRVVLGADESVRTGRVVALG
jgi:predicted dehydrogenase